MRFRTAARSVGIITVIQGPALAGSAPDVLGCVSESKRTQLSIVFEDPGITSNDTQVINAALTIDGFTTSFQQRTEYVPDEETGDYKKVVTSTHPVWEQDLKVDGRFRTNELNSLTFRAALGDLNYPVLGFRMTRTGPYRTGTSGAAYHRLFDVQIDRFVDPRPFALQTGTESIALTCQLINEI